MNTLECKGIVKKFGSNEVLHGVDVSLEKGKIYGLIGRNGAGKTTLLSIASGQNPATAGEVDVDDLKVWDNQDALDKICFSRELNITAGNHYFEKKRRQYKNSQIEIVKELSCLQKTDWTLDDIRHRDEEIRTTIISIFKRWNEEYENAKLNLNKAVI